jgi:branched-chain amino acid transport system substrate-binding protein
MKKKRLSMGVVSALAALLIALLLSSCAASWSQKSTLYNAPDAEQISIGIAYPVEEIDKDTLISEGINLAVDQINRNGGVLGKPLAVVLRDDQGNASTAMQIAQTFHDTGITAVVGHWSSNVCYYVEDIYEENQVVMVTPQATSGSLFEYEYEYIFRMVPSNQQYADPLAEQMRRSGKQRVAIYYSDNEYGQDFAREVEAALARQGIPVVDRVNSVTSGNMEEIAMRWNAFDCDAVVICETPPEVEEPMKLILEYMPQLTVYGADNFERMHFRQVMKEYANGLWKAGYDLSQLDQDFVDAFSETYDQLPDIHAITGYQAIYLLRDAMEGTGGIDGPALAEWISTREEYPTIAGSITFNPETREFDGRELTVSPIREEETQ